MRMRNFFLLGLLGLTFAGLSLLSAHPGAAQARVIRAVNASAAPGATVNVAIELDAQGNENAVGFSLTFNPTILSNPTAVLGSGANGATINSNANQAAQGRFGIVLALPSGQTFASGTRQLAVVTFTVAGNAANGATPIGFGDLPVSREVADAQANVLTTTFTSGNVTIQTCPTITISPSTLPNGQIGVAYSQQLTRTGGAGSVTWSISAGSLPGNVTLGASTGLLSGAPTASGTFNFTARVIDTNGCIGTQAYTLVINPCPTITLNPTTLPGGTVGVLYSQTLTASGGAGGYTFSVNTGSSLPSGLSLTGGGTLSGTVASAGTFTFTLRATDQNGCFGTQAYSLTIAPASGNAGLMFYPLSRPLRLLDTRPANERPGPAFDTPGAKLVGNNNGGTPRVQQAQVTFDGQIIPATARAIVGTATVINNPGPGEYDGTGNVTFYPSDANKPEVSNLNYAANQTISNSFTVGLSPSGAFSIFTFSNVHLVVEVVGYYAPPGAGGLYYHPLARPIRLLETRPELFYPGCDTPRAKLTGGSVRTQQGRVSCDGVVIPPAALALVGNITTVNASANGIATTYAGDLASTPIATSLAYVSTQAIPNAFITRLANDGTFKLYVSQTTDFLVDIAGYFSTEANDSNGQGLLFTQLPRPIRLLETRVESFYPGCDTPRQPLIGNTEREQQARGACDGVTIPITAQAINGNATVVNFISPGSGNVTLYPSAANRPEVSNLNYVANQVIPNAFTVNLSPEGKFTIYVFSTIHLLIDVSGYYAP